MLVTYEYSSIWGNIFFFIQPVPEKPFSPPKNPAVPSENKYAVVAKKTENMVQVNEESEEEESIEVEPGAGTDSANTQLPGGVIDKKGVVTENTMVKERGVVEEKIKID